MDEHEVWLKELWAGKPRLGRLSEWYKWAEECGEAFVVCMIAGDRESLKAVNDAWVTCVAEFDTPMRERMWEHMGIGVERYAREILLGSVDRTIDERSEGGGRQEEG